MWNLDERELSQKALDFIKANCPLNDFNGFKVGDKIKFMTGQNNHIPAVATIKGIGKDGGLYVYSDCYWFPIYQSREQYQIQKL